MFLPLNKPPQWLLDAMFQHENSIGGESKRKCPDCGVLPQTPHQEGCDVARCTKCGHQRLACSCKDGSGDKWTGLWPGVLEAYTKGFVVYDTASGQIMFDINRVVEDKAGMFPPGTTDKQYAKNMCGRQVPGMGGEGWF